MKLRVKELREDKGMTIHQLANESGLTCATIYYIERKGKDRVSPQPCSWRLRWAFLWRSL